MNTDSNDSLQAVIATLGDYFSNSENYFSIEKAELLERNHLGAFAYWSFQKSEINLPASFSKEFRVASSRQFAQQCEAGRLFSLLEDAMIPFVPIKGADLAFRIYPEAALRPFVDWDIWVQPHDLKRFLDFLKKEGWICPAEAYSDHHAGVRSKDKFHIEPHFSLPNFPDIATEDLWQLTRPVAGKKAQRELSPELNLIMLFQHNAICHFQSTHVVKLLLDTEFLLRHSPVDWALVAKYTGKWKLPHPGMLFDAFPEFFKVRCNSGVNFPRNAVSALRDLLLNPQHFADESSLLNLNDARFGSFNWLKKHIKHYSVGNLSWRYPLLKKHKALYLYFLSKDVIDKVVLLLRQRNKSFSPMLREHLIQADIVENSWQFIQENAKEKSDSPCRSCSSSSSL